MGEFPFTCHDTVKSCVTSTVPAAGPLNDDGVILVGWNNAMFSFPFLRPSVLCRILRLIRDGGRQFPLPVIRVHALLGASGAFLRAGLRLHTLYDVKQNADGYLVLPGNYG